MGNPSLIAKTDFQIKSIFLKQKDVLLYLKKDGRLKLVRKKISAMDSPLKIKNILYFRVEMEEALEGVLRTQTVKVIILFSVVLIC